MPVSTFTHFSTLSEIEKNAVVRRCNLLRAYILSPRADGPQPATKNIVTLDSNISEFATEFYTSTTEVVSVYSERDFKFSKSCWSKAAVSASSPWLSASVEAQSSGTSLPTTTRQTFLTANYKFPFVTYAVDPSDLIPNPEFVKAVRVALDLHNPEAKSFALARVFKHWGHVITTRVDIGCSLLTSDIQTFKSKEEQTEAEHQIKLSLDAKVGLYSASAGGKESKTSSEIDKDTKSAISSIGGDPRLAGDHVAWINSVNDASTWSVIELKSVVPVTELLDQSLQDRIARLSPPVLYHLRGRLSCFFTPNGHLSSYIEHSVPLDLTQSFTISGWHKKGGHQRWLTIASVESPSANNSIFWIGMMYGIFPGVTAVVSVNPEKEDGWRVLPAKTPAPLEEWQHFAFVMRVNATDDAGAPLENVFILYINGHQEQDMMLAAGLLNLPNPRLCIGRRLSRNVKADNFDGQIENLKLVQGALTQAQIKFESSQNIPHEGGYFWYTDVW